MFLHPESHEVASTTCTNIGYSAGIHSDSERQQFNVQHLQNGSSRTGIRRKIYCALALTCSIRIDSHAHHLLAVQAIHLRGSLHIYLDIRILAGSNP
jgi:hypothetical protein